MKRPPSKRPRREMRAEYDFSGGVRGKYADRTRRGPDSPSASSRPAKLISVSAESIFSRPLSKKQKGVLSRIAKRQAAGDDSGIDYSDIPRLTDKQVAQFRRRRRYSRPLASTAKSTTGSCSLARVTRLGSTASCVRKWNGLGSSIRGERGGVSTGLAHFAAARWRSESQDSL